jgi:hypothetical protein
MSDDKKSPPTGYRPGAQGGVGGLPSNDADYFRARMSLGVIPRGTSVRLVNAPVAIDRPYAAPYWAQIEWK